MSLYDSKKVRSCSIENCQNKHHAKGYCEKHYRRFLKHNSTDKPSRKGIIAGEKNPNYGNHNYRTFEEVVKIGLYDSIILKNIKCPYCGEVSKMEFQTKDGECFMNIYKKGDKFDKGQFRKIDAYGICDSLTCQFESAKESVWTAGYYGGFSRGFDAIIYCDEKGKITGKMKITKLTSHKGIMKGKLGELKQKNDNMKVVKYADFKKGKWIGAKLKRMTTNGWLDKFKEDLFGGKKNYQNVLYFFNLEDSEEAMKLWFVLRHKLDEILKYLIKELKLKDKEIRSVFLSNQLEEFYEFLEVKDEKRN